MSANPSSHDLGKAGEVRLEVEAAPVPALRRYPVSRTRPIPPLLHPSKVAVASNKLGTPPARVVSLRSAATASVITFLLTFERGACIRRNVGIRVGVPADSPTALRRLGQ
jgi:hypothetical protein